MNLFQGAQRFEDVGADTGNSRGTAVVPGGTVHTKGSWVQLIASTSFAADGIVVKAAIVLVAVGQHLTDIGIGAAASEQVLLPDLFSQWATLPSPALYVLPIRIPAGTRISARTQSNATTSQIVVSGQIFQGGWDMPRLGRLTAYGVNTADTGGTQVDPGGTIHTKGSWSELVASTAHRTRHLSIAFGGQNNLVRTTANQLLDVGIGAGGSEVVLIPNIFVYQNLSTDSFHPLVTQYPCDIPAGTRIAVRAQSSITDATDRLFDVMAWGAD